MCARVCVCVCACVYVHVCACTVDKQYSVNVPFCFHSVFTKWFDRFFRRTHERRTILRRFVFHAFYGATKIKRFKQDRH